MKAAPLFCRQWPKDRMVQKLDTAAKTLFGIGQHRVHGDESVVELAQRCCAFPVFRSGVLRSRASRRQRSERRYVKRADAVEQRWPASKSLAGLQGFQRTLGSCGVAKEQMLKNLGATPFPWWSVAPFGLRHRRRQTLRFAADLCQLRRHVLDPAEREGS